jgi:hypothetical protein
VCSDHHVCGVLAEINDCANLDPLARNHERPQDFNEWHDQVP